MKQYKNEKGYALLIVLFLVVFIMSVTAVFMRGSISNAKQEEIIDNSHLSIVAAEMGVDYYKNSYLNRYQEVKEDIWKEYFDEFIIDKEKIKKNNNIKDKEYAIKILALDKRNLMAQRLLKEMDELDLPKEKSITPQARFITDNNNPILSENTFGVDILREIMGTYNVNLMGTKVYKDLNMSISFEFPDLMQLGGNFIEGNNEVDWSWFQKKDVKTLNPIPTKDCPTNPNGITCKGHNFDDISNANNTKIYFDKEITGGKNNVDKDFKQSEIYIENIKLPKIKNYTNIGIFAQKNINFDNGENGYISDSNIESGNELIGGFIRLSNSKVYVKKNIKTHKIDIRGNSSYLYVGNELIADNESNFTNSKVLIGNNLKSKFMDVNNSTIIVQNNFINESKLNIKNNSKICIGEDFVYKSLTIDSSSKIFYVKDNDVFKKSFSSNAEQVSKEELMSKCKTVGDGEGVNWKTPEVNVDY